MICGGVVEMKTRSLGGEDVPGVGGKGAVGNSVVVVVSSEGDDGDALGDLRWIAGQVDVGVVVVVRIVEVEVYCHK